MNRTRIMLIAAVMLTLTVMTAAYEIKAHRALAYLAINHPFCVVDSML